MPFVPLKFLGKVRKRASAITVTRVYGNRARRRRANGFPALLLRRRELLCGTAYSPRVKTRYSAVSAEERRLDGAVCSPRRPLELGVPALASEQVQREQSLLEESQIIN